jgi:hypothetical protein
MEVNSSPGRDQWERGGRRAGGDGAQVLGRLGRGRRVDVEHAVRGTVGYADDAWNPTEKISMAHTLFPIDWREAEIQAAGEDLFENGTRQHGGTQVEGVHRGVKMLGNLRFGVPTGFFPTGGR